MTSTYQTAPIDKESAARLEAQGMRLGLVDTSDKSAFTSWLHAVGRGFHGPRSSDEAIEQSMQALAYRRTTGVWDSTGADPATPVATVNSWPGPLTVPGGSSVDAWAISFVTVATTHRRRGVARALLEGELRTATRLGVPMAMLTVSESTIYGRYGFAPAAMSSDLTITSKAKWIGPEAPGRLHFLTVEQARVQGPELMERVRLATPGEIQPWESFFDRPLALRGDDKEKAKQIRVVRYDDPDGVAQGLAVYSLKENEEDFSAHTLEVGYLLAATDDAYAGLWRYLLEVDLVAEVKAHLRSVDEPLLWQVSDFRAITRTERDHLWLRILDVAGSLQARTYSAPGRTVFDVADPLGFAAGRYLLEVGLDGTGSVSPVEEVPDDAAHLSLGVSELSAIYLGGVAAATLARSGRVTELRPGSAGRADAAFRSPVTPYLSIWF